MLIRGRLISIWIPERVVLIRGRRIFEDRRLLEEIRNAELNGDVYFLRFLLETPFLANLAQKFKIVEIWYLD